MFVFIEGIYLVNSNTNVVVVSKNCRVPLLTRTFFGWQCPFFPPLFLCPLLLTKSWPQFCFTPSQWNHSQTKPSQTKPNQIPKPNWIQQFSLIGIMVVFARILFLGSLQSFTTLTCLDWWRFIFNAERFLKQISFGCWDV